MRLNYLGNVHCFFSGLLAAAFLLSISAPASLLAQEKESRDRRQNQERERTDVQATPAETATTEAANPATETPKAADSNPPAGNTTPNSNARPPATTEKPVTPPPPPSPPKRKEEPSNSTPTAFTLRGNSANLILRIHGEGDPANTEIQVVEGNKFTTDLSLINQEAKPYNRVRLVLDYNPSFVDPLVINDSALLEFLDGEPTIQVNRKLGQIIYDGNLIQPVSTSQSIIFIEWRALKPVLMTSLRFGRNITFGYTEIFLDDEPLLGEPQEQGDGVVSSTLRIIPADPAEALMMQEEPQLYIGSDERVGGVELRLIPPKTPPRVGEEFYVYVVMDNSVYSNLDKVSLMIEFNPELLTVLDDDFDNWITHGTNILDGEYHKQFPFNYHIANVAYNVRGMIEYRVGTSLPDQFVGVVGTMARIKLVGLKPTSNAELSFFFAPREGMKTTEVKFLGQDSLGETSIVNDGTRGARFAILPELQNTASSN